VISLLVLVGVLGLVCAVVLLFAMFGELTRTLQVTGILGPDTLVGAQLAALGNDGDNAGLRPLAEARVGATPRTWPSRLEMLAAEDDSATILVLSTTCRSCEGVAAELSAALDQAPLTATGLLISCGNETEGEDFARRYRLNRIPYHVDRGGEWVLTEFGVRTSPSALFVRERRLDDARTFLKLADLQAVTLNGRELST
jgi:hypothetical protein